MKQMMQYLVLLLLALYAGAAAQTITWQDVTAQHTLPQGVRLFLGTRASPALRAWYLDVDLNTRNLAIKAYTTPAGKEGVVPFAQRFGAFAAVNGGYFDLASNTSYSAVVQPEQLLARNINSVVRDAKTYTLTRSFFGIRETREMSIDWIFHFGSRVSDIYRYANPTANAQGTPAPGPSPATGSQYFELVTGIGGGPTLIDNGQVRITYDEEVFWGSGVGLTNRDPRSAVGFTANRHVILLAADGRQTASEGFSLTELAQVMLGLGCVEAMNLDGGGSTQMAVNNALVNLPEGATAQRPVASILAVVKADSLPLLPPIYLKKIIDSGEPACTFTGSGWYASTVGGFWGTTPTQLCSSGTGDNYAAFKLNLPRAGSYQIDGWWTAATNRANNTPFVIKRQGGTDTVRVDQTVNGGKWNKIGTFTFTGTAADEVLITNRAQAGANVAVDAIRILSFDSTLTGTKDEGYLFTPSGIRLLGNYPNPFNPETTIAYTWHGTGELVLKVYDVLGNKVSEAQTWHTVEGYGEVRWSGSGAGARGSGVYFYSLAPAGSTAPAAKGKLLLMK